MDVRVPGVTELGCADEVTYTGGNEKRRDPNQAWKTDFHSYTSENGHVRESLLLNTDYHAAEGKESGEEIFIKL